MEEKNYLILEQSSFGDINHFQDGNAYILEGIFAKFDNKQNQNGRIYKEDDYLPQLEELQEQIKEGNLLGQIDHPEKVETSLAKASHVIEKLEYDSKEHVVRGRIRLLSGFYGQMAKDLINDGWKHSATLDVRRWIEHICNRSEDIEADVINLKNIEI